MEDLECCAGSLSSTGQQGTTGDFVQKNAINGGGNFGKSLLVVV